MKDQIELHFTNGGSPRLVRTVLRSSRGCRVCDERRETAPGGPCFTWGRGIRSLSLALLRLRVANESRGMPLLVGGRGSAASTVDNLVHKADGLAYLRDMLEVSPGDSPRRRLQMWFDRRNSQLNDPSLPVEIFRARGSHALLPAQITVLIDGGEVDHETLTRLILALRLDLADPDPTVLKIFGTLPAGHANHAATAFHRASLHAALSHSVARGVEIIGPPASGKTGLVADWIRQLADAGGWSFRRVVICALDRCGVRNADPYAQWVEVMEAALGVRVPLDVSPADASRYLLALAADIPTLYVFDGLESVMSEPEAGVGRIQCDALVALLMQLLFSGPKSFFVITTRVPVADLASVPQNAVGRMRVGES